MGCLSASHKGQMSSTNSQTRRHVRARMGHIDGWMEESKSLSAQFQHQGDAFLECILVWPLEGWPICYGSTPATFAQCFSPSVDRWKWNTLRGFVFSSRCRIFYCITQKYNNFQTCYQLCVAQNTNNQFYRRETRKNEHRYESSFDLAPHAKPKIPFALSPVLVENSMYKKCYMGSGHCDYCACVYIQFILLVLSSSSAWA